MIRVGGWGISPKFWKSWWKVDFYIFSIGGYNFGGHKKHAKLKVLGCLEYSQLLAAPITFQAFDEDVVAKIKKYLILGLPVKLLVTFSLLKALVAC